MPRIPALSRSDVARCAPATSRGTRSDARFRWRGRCIAALCGLMASLSTVAGDLPAWPETGVAERRFLAGDVMFIERRADRWHAWILPEQSQWRPPRDGGPHAGGWRGGVLDFFSGAVVDAELHEDESGHARPVFFSVGGVHAPARFGGRSAVALGLLREQRFHDLRFDDDDRLDASRLEGCATRLQVVRRIDPGTRTVSWSRLVLRRSPPTAECPHGRWSSQVVAALDLHDGTFLAVLDDRVVRLDAATLDPVGSDAQVWIIDMDALLPVPDAGGDLHARLNAALRHSGE